MKKEQNVQIPLSLFVSLMKNKNCLICPYYLNFKYIRPKKNKFPGLNYN